MITELFVFENWFLIAVAVLWILVASIQDFRKREVANWWNFSLIIIVLAYRIFLSIAKTNYWYALWGVIGLGAGFAVHGRLGSAVALTDWLDTSNGSVRYYVAFGRAF